MDGKYLLIIVSFTILGFRLGSLRPPSLPCPAQIECPTCVIPPASECPTCVDNSRELYLYKRILGIDLESFSIISRKVGINGEAIMASSGFSDSERAVNMSLLRVFGARLVELARERRPLLIELDSLRQN